MIETRGKERVGDDDPTRILVREREEPRTERASEQVGAAAGRSRPRRARRSRLAGDREEGGAAADATGPGDGTPAWLIAMVVIVVLAGGAFATWWFGFR